MKAIRNQRILYYWFEPDETLLDLRHARLILPPHSAAGWLKGDFRTGGEEVYNREACQRRSPNLSAKSEDVCAEDETRGR